MITAFDISHHNGKDVTTLLRDIDDKPPFLYIKMSEGLTIVQKDYFYMMLEEAKNSGIIVGGYHYCNPGNSKLNNLDKTAANIEAGRLSTISNLTELVPMLDVEEKYMLLDRQHLARYLDMLFYSYMTSTNGKKAGIYASYSLLTEDCIQNVIRDYNLVVWCARYKYESAHLACDSSMLDVSRYLQTTIDDIPVDINQFAKRYYDSRGKEWPLDCNVVFNPLRLLK